LVFLLEEQHGFGCRKLIGSGAAGDARADDYEIEIHRVKVLQNSAQGQFESIPERCLSSGSFQEITAE
jgi:hypothetical protein